MGTPATKSTAKQIQMVRIIMVWLPMGVGTLFGFKLRSKPTPTGEEANAHHQREKRDGQIGEIHGDLHGRRGGALTVHAQDNFPGIQGHQQEKTAGEAAGSKI